MGCLTSILRAGAGLVLGVVIFVGFLFVLILNNFSDKLLSADFYMSTIAAEDTYDRIYNEVLVDDGLKDRTQELLGDIKIVEHQEIVDLLEEIMPPAYIKGQVEASIARTIAAYLRRFSFSIPLSSSNRSARACIGPCGAV